MTQYVGVDWAGGRWISVMREGKTTTVDTHPAFLNVWDQHPEAAAILVDIPIGLPESGTRACDQEARDWLGDRHSSIFDVPVRDAVYADDYPTATAINDEQGGGGISSQTWGIVPRIRAVDTVLRRHDGVYQRVYESHPEVCYAALAEDTPIPDKRSEDGIARRIELLETIDPTGADAVASAVETARDAAWHRRIQSGRIDDLLDAAVLASVAQDLALTDRQTASYPSFPRAPPTDSQGFAMEIVRPGYGSPYI